MILGDMIVPGCCADRSEKVKWSTEWLSKSLIKVEAKQRITVGCGKSMWLHFSPWPSTTRLCLGDKSGGKTVDGVTEDGVRSETG
jgi:hypothetical protein